MSTGLLYRLEYHLEVDDWCVSFDHPSPIVWSPGPFELTLENGHANLLIPISARGELTQH